MYKELLIVSNLILLGQIQKETLSDIMDRTKLQQNTKRHRLYHKFSDHEARLKLGVRPF